MWELLGATLATAIVWAVATMSGVDILRPFIGG